MLAHGLLDTGLAVFAGCGVGIACTWLAISSKHRREVSRLELVAAKLKGSLSLAVEKQTALVNQLATLRTELEQQKAKIAKATSTAAAGRRATDFPEVPAMNDPFGASLARRTPLGFEDTQILEGDAGTSSSPG